jgi:hypothetical protein
MTQNKQYIEQHKKYIEQHKNLEECGPFSVFAGFTMAFALQLRKKHGKGVYFIQCKRLRDKVNVEMMMILKGIFEDTV